MAITFVSAGSGVKFHVPVTAAFNSTGANFIVVAVTSDSAWFAPGASECIDSVGNTYVRIQQIASGSIRETLYYCLEPITSATHTVTINSNCGASAVQARAYSGVAGYSAKVTSASGASPLSSGSLTPNANGALLFVALGRSVASTDTQPSGFSTPVTQAFSAGLNYQLSTSELIQTTAAAINPAWTYTGAGNAAAVFAVFEASGSTTAHLSQVALEVATLSSAAVPAIVSQAALEIATLSNAPVPAYVSQVAVEIAYLQASTQPARLSQVALEIAYVEPSAVTSDFEGDLQPLTGSFTGEIPQVGAFDAYLAPLTGSFFAYLGDPTTASIDGTLQPLEGEFVGAVPLQGLIDATTGRMAALILGGQPLSGAIDVTLPRLDGDLVGGVSISAVIGATLPALTALLTSGEIEAIIDTSIPSIRGAFVAGDDTGITASFAGRLRRMRASFRAEFPIDQLTLTVNGVDVGDWWWMPGGWNIHKDDVTERMTFFLRDERYHEDAVTADVNDVVLLTHPTGGLIFGGIVVEIEVSRINSENGTLTRVECSDWLFLTEQIFVPRQKFFAQDAYVLFGTLFERYLEPKGFTSLNAPSGGPMLPDLVIDTPVTTLKTLLDRMREETGQPTRANGELEIAMVEEGSLIWPGGEINGSNAKLLPDVKWTKEINKTTGDANRLWAQSTKGPGAEGAYWHEESHLADGIKTVFLTNVIPVPVRASLKEAVAALATSVVIKELPKGAVVRWADTFYLGGDPREYMVTVGGVANDDGEVTISCEPIELDASEGAEIKFNPPMGLKLYIGGVETPFAGSPWVWENIECAMVNPTAPVPAGIWVKIGMWIEHPAYIRCWETAELVPLTPEGWFDYDVLVDDKLDDEEYYSLPYAAERLREKLATPILGRQVVTFETHEHGIYPFISFPMNFPHSRVVGTYFCESVEISPSGADRRLTTKELRYTVTARKDVMGRRPWDYFRAKSGVKWGLIETIDPINFQWSANPEKTAPAAQDGFLFTPSTTSNWAWEPWQTVFASTSAALVITCVIVEETDAAIAVYGLFSDTRGFEIQLAVSDVGVDPTEDDVIVKLKGHAKDNYYAAETCQMRLMLPVDNCPAGKQLSIRLRCSNGGYPDPVGGPWRLAVQYYEKPLTGNLQTTPYVQQHTNEGEFFTEVTGAAVLNEWNDWVELIDDVPYDAYLTAFMFYTRNVHDPYKNHIQFGIANLGEEPIEDEGVLATLSITSNQISGGTTQYHTFDNPLFVNSNQRVMVRTKMDYQTLAEMGFVLHYVRAEE